MDVKQSIFGKKRTLREKSMMSFLLFHKNKAKNAKTQEYGVFRYQNAETHEKHS